MKPQDISSKFRFELQPLFFEQDTHIEIQNRKIQSIHVLGGVHAKSDIVVVVYEGCPFVTFYDAFGKLVDIDHYLLETYHTHDEESVETVIENLRELSPKNLASASFFKKLVTSNFSKDTKNITKTLRESFGLETDEGVVQRFLETQNISKEQSDLGEALLKQFDSVNSLLQNLIAFQQSESGYIHITPNGNIIITPLNRRCGMSVIIETQNAKGNLLHPSNWNVVRTSVPTELEQSLPFRLKDVQDYFNNLGTDHEYSTERYLMQQSIDLLVIDSLLDNTDNVLRLPLVNNCFQILHSDKNVIVALTDDKELTIVNTHRSIVPGKWVQKISLPRKIMWARIEDNASILFAQDELGEIFTYDITSNVADEITTCGKFKIGFELDQNGHVYALDQGDGSLVKIETNLEAINFSENFSGVDQVLENLSHLFKGDQLFSTTVFAKVIGDETEKEHSVEQSIFDPSRYAFEANIEHMLVQAGNDYKALLGVQSKIGIARQNLAAELTAYAEKAGVMIVGKRLKSAVDHIIEPAEDKVCALIEKNRAQQIMIEMRQLDLDAKTLIDPSSYKDYLNQIRAFKIELDDMFPDHTSSMLGEFQEIHQRLTNTFSEQLAEDGTVLQAFIVGEIQQIEEVIKSTHEEAQLEVLLSVHPASLELMNLLKQDYVLQTIAKDRALSPAGIQRRLFEAVSKRKIEIRKIQASLEVERQASKMQLSEMIQESITFFVDQHSGGYSEVELSQNATYQQLVKDFKKLESTYQDVRLSMELQKKLQRKILEKSRSKLDQIFMHEGKYAYIQNDPDLFVELESTTFDFPKWSMQLFDLKNDGNRYGISFKRETDKLIHRPDLSDHLEAGRAFELNSDEYGQFSSAFELYANENYSISMLDALWKIRKKRGTQQDFPQFGNDLLKKSLPKDEVSTKALRCALEKKILEQKEKTRVRNVPDISPDFIDETPFFQRKLHEFIIKSKIQLLSGSGVILLSGPPSTGKSVFLKFVASITNREYFEHAADKWQTKNSLVTAIGFGDHGPYVVPAGFTRAITTPHSLVNIEEIKEWPEALRKSLNPFFGGSKIYTAPDGTRYKIGENILMCAAANMGSIYRREDEPFTADFWSRLEVVELGYAPEEVTRAYYKSLHSMKDTGALSVHRLVKHFFAYDLAPSDAQEKAIYLAQKFMFFLLLPKADEEVKRTNLRRHIEAYFSTTAKAESKRSFGPEEAAKVALRRLDVLQGFQSKEFFDLYDHFLNNKNLKSRRLSALQTSDVNRYNHLKCTFFTLRYLEGCLRSIRKKFYASAGQIEIEGTNREFIKSVYLLGLFGDLG